MLPSNLASGQYQAHVVIDPNQLRAVTVESVPEETYFGVTFVSGPAQILPGQSFLADLVLMYWPNIKYERLIAGATFTIREGPHTVGYGRVESVLANGAEHNEGFTQKTCGQFVDRIRST